MKNAVIIENHPADSRVKICEDGVFQTLPSQMGTGGGNVPMVMYENEKNPVCIGNGQADQTGIHDKVGALNCMHDQQCIMYAEGNNGDTVPALDASYYHGCGERNGCEREVVAVYCRSMKENADVNGTLQAKSNGGFNYNSNNVCRTDDIVRRLTEKECERLQFYPDGWTDIGEWEDSKGKKHKTAGSNRYKALGNSIACCAWIDILEKISDIIRDDYGETPKMASLFDGIGGFPMIWENYNGEGSAVWASEIEEFPIAVTKLHFGDEEKGILGDFHTKYKEVFRKMRKEKGI